LTHVRRWVQFPAWDRLHSRLTHRCAWLDHEGGPQIIAGTLIRLQVDHLPGDRNPKPVWLWSSATGTAPDQVGRLCQAFLIWRRIRAWSPSPPARSVGRRRSIAR
jgi:hypothetical protein